MSLGQRLFKLREGTKESLQTVADAVGVSKAHIWELEKERTVNPAMGLVTSLADHYAVTVAYLIGEDINAQDADPQLQRMFRQAKGLEPHERTIVDEMMKSLLKNRSS